MEKKNKKPIIFIGLLVSVFLVVGVTLAYYTTTDTFNNEFNTGNYSIQTQEAFVSPDNWTPGTTTTKTVIATNKGNTPAAVRIKLTPSWEDKNGDPLPLTDGTNEAAIINYSFDKDYKWIYQDGYYYYIRPLHENESTSTLIDSVTFNPAVTFDKTRDCDTVNGVTTCTTTFNDYAGGKYTLKIDVETAQYDKYKEIWNTNVNIDNPEIKAGTLRKNGIRNQFGPWYDTNSTFGNTNLKQYQIESVVMLDVLKVPNNAIESWDVSVEQNGSIMAWYTDVDNNGYYEFYIAQNGGVKANPDSSHEFSYFQKATYLNMKYLDTSNVTDMTEMFYGTGYTEKPLFKMEGLETWDTSKVESMKGLFRYLGRSCDEWEIKGINNWDTSSVTDMSYMFDRAAYLSKSFNINVSNWNVSNVVTMESMFESAGLSAKYFSIGNLSNWNTSKVTDMDDMFNSAGCYATTWNDIGTLKVYADSVDSFISAIHGAKATINIYSNPTIYYNAFRGTATTQNAIVTVNYSSTTTNIDNIIGTALLESNIVKGSQLD